MIIRITSRLNTYSYSSFLKHKCISASIIIKLPSTQRICQTSQHTKLCKLNAMKT